MQKIAVIVPAWNAEEWLAEALQSLQVQGEAFGECVVVDDGSTDSTPDIVRDFAGRDPRFRMLSIANSGPSVARNTALDFLFSRSDWSDKSDRSDRSDSSDSATECSWIAFMDADDVWMPGAFDALLRAAAEAGEECDVIEGNVLKWESGEPEGSDSGKLRVMSGKEAARRSLYQTGVEASLYAKLYRPWLWEDVRFPVGEIYEDLSVFHRVAMRTRRYGRLDRDVYAYRIRPESLIHAFNPRRLVVLEVTERIRRYYSADPALLRAATDRRLAASFNMLGLMLANPAEADSEKMADCRDFIRRHSPATLFNPQVRLKNRLGALAALLLPRRLFDPLLLRMYR